MNDLQRYAFLAECARPELAQHFKSGGPYTHFVTVKFDGLATEGLASSERAGYSSKALSEAVLGISNKLLRGFVEEIVDSSGSQRRRVYAYNHQAGGVVLTYEEKDDDLFVGRGVLLAHEHTGILAEMLRTYGLPFPANMKRS